MGDEPEKHKLVFSGVNGASGGYFTEPLSLDQLLTRVVKRQQWSDSERTAINRRSSLPKKAYVLHPQYGDGSDLATAGWGLVFPADARPKDVDAILEALQPLTSLRKQQSQYYREPLRGGDGFRWPGGKPETSHDFLRRYQAGVGPVDPTKLPFYLLIVGDPNSIPYQFQYEMDTQYLVGRLDFETLDEYARYAETVVAAEKGRITLPRKAAFFGTSHSADDATAISARSLVEPLHNYVAKSSVDEELGWQSELVEPQLASKARLTGLLGGASTPAFLFTATHGVAWPSGDSRQPPFQGALLCQDWPGVQAGRELSPDWFFSGRDVVDDCLVAGLVAFHFACFGAGTPRWDDFSVAYDRPRQALAERAFTSALPRRLLGHPKGGALAVIGHVERAWSYSFGWDDDQRQTEAFESVLYQLMRGKPVGYALDYMNLRYASFAATLAGQVENARYEFVDPNEMASNWIATNDARAYTLLGDPAVRLPLAAKETPASGHVDLAIQVASSGPLPVVLADMAMAAGQDGEGGGLSRPAGFGPSGEPGSVTSNPEPPVKEPIGATSLPQTSPPASPLEMLVQLNRAYGDQGIPQAYGLTDDISNALRGIVSSLTSAFRDLSNSLSDLAKDLSAMDVETFVVPDLGEKSSGTGDAFASYVASQATRVAWTRVRLDGDTQTALPSDQGRLTEALWQSHKDMVSLAQINRATMIKAAVEALAGLVMPPKAG